MKEIFSKSKVSVIKEGNNWGVEIKHDNGGSSFEGYSTKEDAEKAIRLARFLQVLGLSLRADRKIMVKKIK